jgi:hypothetical protein
MVTDTLKNKFKVNCSGNLCSLTPQDPDVVAKSCVQSRGTDTFVLVLSNVLTIMALPVTSAGEYQMNSANPARPVACKTATDCLAPSLALNVNSVPLSYVCTNGLCQLPDQPLLTNDVIALCQADLPWPGTCPYLTNPQFVERLTAIAALCGSKFYCDKVPAACAQPTALPDAGAPVVTPDAAIPGVTPDTATPGVTPDASAPGADTADTL